MIQTQQIPETVEVMDCNQCNIILIQDTIDITFTIHQSKFIIFAYVKFVVDFIILLDLLAPKRGPLRPWIQSPYNQLFDRSQMHVHAKINSCWLTEVQVSSHTITRNIKRIRRSRRKFQTVQALIYTHHKFNS